MTLTDVRTDGNYTHRSVVDSSNLAEVLYDSETSRLFVVFKSGSVAGYADVPYAEYERLLEADADDNGSVGRTYNQIFRSKRWGRPAYAGVVAPDRFVFRQPVAVESWPEVEDVTTATEVNSDGLAPWATNPVDEDVEVKSPGVESPRSFEVTILVEAEDVPSLVTRLTERGLGNTINSIVEV